MTDPSSIRSVASQIDADLEGWTPSISRSWAYATVPAPAGTYFQGKRHVYDDPWAAQVWNSWRTLRILVNRLIIEYSSGTEEPAGNIKHPAFQLIRRLSTDICISTADYIGSPRKRIRLHQGLHQLPGSGLIRGS